jgi:hypothetical protein
MTTVARTRIVKSHASELIARDELIEVRRCLECRVLPYQVWVSSTHSDRAQLVGERATEAEALTLFRREARERDARRERRERGKRQ